MPGQSGGAGVISDPLYSSIRCIFRGTCLAVRVTSVVTLRVVEVPSVKVTLCLK